MSAADASAASSVLGSRKGPAGQVLAIDSATVYLEHLEQQLQQRAMPQLRTLRHDLANASGSPPPGLEGGSGDGAWCRWVAMFLPRLEPLLDLVTYALRPSGSTLARFVERCIKPWRDHGADPDVAQRAPTLPEARGFRLLQSSSLMACSPSNHPKTQWLLDFLSSYPAQLIAADRWSAAEQATLEAELALGQLGQRHASLWVTPAVVERVWQRP